MVDLNILSNDVKYYSFLRALLRKSVKVQVFSVMRRTYICPFTPLVAENSFTVLKSCIH